MKSTGLEEHMLPCISKKYLGMDCLGCGAQRAAVFLFKGEFFAAFKMYPAIYTLLLFAGFISLNYFIKFKYAETIKIILVVLNIFLIIGNYIYKFF